VKLIEVCWDHEPERRPFFPQIVEILSKIFMSSPELSVLKRCRSIFSTQFEQTKLRLSCMWPKVMLFNAQVNLRRSSLLVGWRDGAIFNYNGTWTKKAPQSNSKQTNKKNWKADAQSNEKTACQWTPVIAHPTSIFTGYKYLVWTNLPLHNTLYSRFSIRAGNNNFGNSSYKSWTEIIHIWKSQLHPQFWSVWVIENLWRSCSQRIAHPCTWWNLKHIEWGDATICVVQFLAEIPSVRIIEGISARITRDSCEWIQIIDTSIACSERTTSS